MNTTIMIIVIGLLLIFSHKYMYELGKHHGIRHVTKLIQAFMGDDMTGANRTENKS